MKRLIIVYLLGFWFNGASQEVSEPPGILKDSVEVKGASGESYTLYLPSTYKIDESSPIVFIFDPAARGLAGVRPFIEASEKYNHILICSNNAKNGPYTPNLQIADRLFQTVLPAYSIDQNRIYTAGFSGGSRLAAAIAVLSNAMQGVIACGAGFPKSPMYFPNSNNSFTYVGLVGDLDMNYQEMHKTSEWMAKLGLQHELFLFEGEHQWPPPATIVKAFDWLERQAIARGLVPINEEQNKNSFDETLATARAYEEKGKLLEAVTEYERLLKDFSGYMPVDSLQPKIKRIKKQKAYKKALAIQKKVAVLEDTLSSNFLKRFRDEIAQGKSPDEFKWWKNRVKNLRQKYSNSEDTVYQKMGFRLERQLFALAIESFNSFLRENKVNQIQYTEQLLLVLAPDNPLAHYQLARGYASRNMIEKSLLHLEKVLQLGWTNKDFIRSTKEFIQLKEHPEFKRILSTY
jgi:tetratricopeptide (TPR) repeat protein